MTASADDVPPEVTGPVDRPGAEVVWFANEEYTLDVTGSTDDVGIVSYKWEITDPDGMKTEIISTSPTEKWTPTKYGIHKIVAWAFDAAGNKGFNIFAMDVAEAISGQTISDTSVSYDHSVAVKSGSLTYKNTNIEVTGGRPADAAGGGAGESPISENVEVRSGPFAGYWQPYYNDPYYGQPSTDSSNKLSGKASILFSGGSYAYGGEFVFDKPVDLTKYNSLVYWFQGDSSYGPPYPYVYGARFTVGGNTQSYTGYMYNYIYSYSGYVANEGGWMGITISLDFNSVGYYSSYNFDPTQCSSIWFYCYGYRYVTEMRFDCIYLARETYNDNITESASPSGEWSGYWSCSGATISTSSSRYVGSSSVYFYGSSGYRYINYYWDNPVDLSSYNALRLFNYYSNYYYCQIRDMYFESTSGYANFQQYSSNYFNYYASYNYGRWFVKTIGFDKLFYNDYGMDWTQVTRMQFSLYFPSTMALRIDGLEFYKSAGATGVVPTIEEDIPHGIYAIKQGKLTMENVKFTSTSPFGAFVRCDNDLYVKDSTFDGLWGTTHSSIKTSAQTYGGILAFSANNCTLDGVTITKASSSGIYVENSNVNAKNLDLQGYGSKFPGAAGLIIAQVGTDRTFTNKVTITKSKFYNSDGGNGLSIVSQDALGSADIRVEDITAHDNGLYGMSIEVIGRTGNTSVVVERSSFYLNDAAGFVYYAHDCKPVANTRVRFEVADSEAYDNGAYGFMFLVQKAIVSATGTLRNVETYTNDNSGIGIELSNFAGDLTLNYKGVITSENFAHGMYIKTTQSNFKDMDGGATQADGWLNLNMEDSQFVNNDGSGVYDYSYYYGSYNDPVRPKVNQNFKAVRCEFSRNGEHGYSTRGSSSLSQYGCRDVTFYAYDSSFSENVRSGVYSYPYYYNYMYYGGQYVYERLYFINSTFTYNQFGILQDLTSYYCDGNEVYIEATGCTFQDNDVEAFRVQGLWDSYGGYTYLYGGEYHIKDSLVDGFVSMDINGLTDNYYGTTPTYGKIYIENVTYTQAKPMFFRISTMQWSYNQPCEAVIVYKDVKHTSPSTGDGIYAYIMGSTILKARVEVSNVKFDSPLGDGVHVELRTSMTSSSYTRQIQARVTLTNVEILNPMDKGLFVEMSHALPAGAISKGTYSLNRVTIKNSNEAVRTHNMDGEIINCKFTGTKQENVYTRFGVIDIYESEIGPISTTNLIVDQKGAIRLWFSLRVKVVWKGTDDFIKGASVEIKDNSWNIIGINTIQDENGVLFMNLNSYTVLPDGIFTKNPYIVTVDYIGIIKEVRLNVEKNTDATIELLDNVAPRLTVETPKDGQEQRERHVTVKGTAYDKHTGLEGVYVSTNGEDWDDATLGEDGFTYTYELTDLEDGLTIVWVRSYDNAGNHKELAATILVDSTPPSLDVITPTDGMKTNKRNLEIVGTTDVGTDVYINDRPIEIQYTLISHQMILAEGPNAIKVTAVDHLGNVREVLRYVTLDTQAPYIAMVTESGTVNTEKVTIVGLTETTDVTILVQGRKVPIDSDGRFTATVSLKEGLNKIEIRGIDSVGNERSILLPVTLDRSAPWVRLVEPSGEVSTVNDIRVSGFVELGSTVFINEREVDVTFGHFQTTVSAQEGDAKIRIVAIDEAGNEAIIERTIRVDTVAPALEVLYPRDGYVTNVPTIEVAGSISIDDEREADIRYIELYINEVPRLFNFLSGTFSQEVMLEEGVNRIEVLAIDPVGNEARAVRTVMLDSQAPYLSVSLGNVRNDPNWNEPVSLSDFIYVSGFTEIGAALTINGVAVEVDTETGSFNYSLDLPAPSGGLRIATTTVHVESVDAAGNMAMHEQDVNRIKEVETEEKGVDTAQWLVLLLALVIFGLSFAGAMSYQRIQAQEEVIEALETRPQMAVTAEGKAVSSPPSRPARGGRARHKPASKDEVVIDLDKKEGE